MKTTDTWLYPSEPVPTSYVPFYERAKAFMESPEGADLASRVHSEGKVVALPLVRPRLLPFKALRLSIVIVRQSDVEWARLTNGYEAPTQPLTYVMTCRCKKRCALPFRTLKVYPSFPGKRVDASRYAKDES